LLSGIALGLIYFGGLWWTVRRLSRSTAPALLAIVSLSLRMALLLAGLYLLLQGQWPRLLAALVGVLLARAFLIRKLGSCHIQPTHG